MTQTRLIGEKRRETKTANVIAKKQLLLVLHKAPIWSKAVFIWAGSKVICFICYFCSEDWMDLNHFISSECTGCYRYSIILYDGYFEVVYWFCLISPVNVRRVKGIVVCVKCSVADTHILLRSLAGWLYSMWSVLEKNTPLWIFGIISGMQCKVAEFKGSNSAFQH